ncbi:MAG: ABC transporter permease [Candidatus Cloacimonetes bacterium]|nr:ABC transporter permease [Candidatus Cloacimonadota bacterium]
MHLSEAIKSSFKNISTHFLRTLLTLIGISIGVFAVVTMFSSVYGLKNLIMKNMEGMGWNNTIIITPSSGKGNNARFSKHRMRFRYMNRKAKPLSIDDYNELRSTVKPKYIYGLIESWTSLYHDQKISSVNVRATNEDYFASKTYPLQKGRYFNTFENENAQKVCVLGYYFVETYFANKDPLGTVITVGENRFKVVGILADDKINKNGMQFNPWQRKHDLKAIYIPLSTGAKYLRSNNSVDTIYLQSHSEHDFKDMSNLTRQTLLAAHNMAHDFAFSDIGSMMLEITQEIDEMMKKWNVTLFAIASISLIVGGIGLFSTLLISITERMMEIGIRKSLGAGEIDIFVLFISEALILSLLASFMGILSSSGIILIISKVTKFDFPIPMQGIILGITFSAVIGLLSGLYPAIKASKLDPIKAIYYSD